MIAQRYTFVKTLGSGSFGSVVQAKDEQTGDIVAVKKLKRSQYGRYVETELLQHRLLQHPHVIRLREVFLTSNHINIVMDFGNGGSLFDYVNQRRMLSEGLARWFLQQLIIGVDYCHKKGVSHRDVKLENILLQLHPETAKPTVKLCDFGYNKPMAADPRTAVGTLRYMAPEVLCNYSSSSSSSYNAAAVDIWSCGVVLFTMLHGRYPFNISESNIALGYRQMLNQDFKLRSDLSSEVQNLIRSMLDPNPSQRITISGIMQDPWYREELPPGASDMNEFYLKQDCHCQQSDADMISLLRMITGGSRSPTPPPAAAAAAPAAAAVHVQ